MCRRTSTAGSSKRARRISSNYDIAADPDLLTLRMSTSESGSLALPYNYVVDPRTMRIKAIDSGAASYGAQIPGLDTLLTKNGG